MDSPVGKTLRVAAAMYLTSINGPNTAVAQALIAAGWRVSDNGVMDPFLHLSRRMPNGVRYVLRSWILSDEHVKDSAGENVWVYAEHHSAEAIEMAIAGVLMLHSIDRGNIWVTL